MSPSLRAALRPEPPEVAGGVLGRRPLRPEDLGRLGTWLADPVVAWWWCAVDASPAGVERQYGPVARGVAPEDVDVALLDGRPIGIVETCPVRTHRRDLVEFSRLTAVPRGAVRMDYLIGEPELRGRGIGPRMIRAAAVEAWRRHPGARALLAAVSVSNLPSWRALEKAGWHRAGEGDVRTACPYLSPRTYAYRLDRP